MMTLPNLIGDPSDSIIFQLIKRHYPSLSLAKAAEAFAAVALAIASASTFLFSILVI